MMSQQQNESVTMESLIDAFRSVIESMSEIVSLWSHSVKIDGFRCIASSQIMVPPFILIAKNKEKRNFFIK